MLFLTNIQACLTLSLHGRLGMPHCLPGAGDVQEDGIRHPGHSEALFAHVLVPDGDQVINAVLLELLGHLLRPLLVELHRVQVTCGGDGAQDGVGKRAAARACNADATGRTSEPEHARDAEAEILTKPILSKDQAMNCLVHI